MYALGSAQLALALWYVLSDSRRRSFPAESRQSAGAFRTRVSFGVLVSLACTPSSACVREEEEGGECVLCPFCLSTTPAFLKKNREIKSFI